jgi:hypothetical protein
MKARTYIQRLTTAIMKIDIDMQTAMMVGQLEAASTSAEAFCTQPIASAVCMYGDQRSGKRSAANRSIHIQDALLKQRLQGHSEENVCIE